MKQSLCLLPALIAGAGLSNHAFAQDHSPDDPVEEILVTGFRTPVPAREASTSLTVLTRQDIENAQVIFLPDLLRRVPGLTIARSGPAGALTQIRVRGGEANQVLVLVDGVRVNDPALGETIQFEHLLADDIERVEVIRAPQSTQWGSEAVSGVINIVTRSGQAGPRLDAHARGGSFGRITAGATAGAQGEISRGSLSVSYFDQTGSNVSRTGTEDDGYENLTLSAKGGLDPLDNFSLAGSVRYVDTESEFDGVDSVSTGLPVDGDQVTRLENLYLSGHAEHEILAQLTHKLELAYADTNTRNFLDGADNGSSFSETFTLRYDLRAEPVSGHTLTAGVDHEDIGFRQRGEATPFGDPNQDQSIRTTGVFADYVGRVHPALTLFASGRRDFNSDFENVSTWRVGATIALPDGRTRLKANAGRGQKRPTFTERFGFFPGSFLGNPDVRPETSTGYDVGLEHDVAEAGLFLALRYFRSELEDEIDGFVFDPASGFFTARNLDGESKREGIEAEFDWRPGGDFQASGSYTYIRSRAPDGQGGLERELRRPKHSASLILDYSGIRRLNANLGLHYTGKSLDVFFPPFPEPQQRVTLDDYVLAELSIRYRIRDGINLLVKVENALDAEYEDVFGFNTPGIGAFAGIGLRF